MADTPRYAGGFLPDGRVSLPSPAPSAASSRAAAKLPHPRSKPLVRGSKKEDFARNYISDRLMHISRRYVKKHGIPDPADEVTGYESMDEVCKDIEEVVDVLWFTSTPSLQIPYLLNVALAFNTYLPAFPPSPHPTFALLKKLDHCFSSLIMGRDIKTGNPLPGFETRGYATTGFSRTDMVRCKSIADETRMLVAMVMSDEPDVENYGDGDGDGNDDDYARPPARRNVSVSLSTGFIQSPVDDSIYSHDESDSKIKTEADDLHFEDSDGESAQSTTAKRKSDDTDHEDDAHEDSKRIKVEQDDEDIGPTFSDAAPGNASPNPFEDEPGPRPSGQFHFMGDDDSDDDEVASPLNSTAYTATTTAATVATTPSAVQRGPDTEQEMGEPIEDVDEEEEELQLNVGKVYIKTLLELGKSLGESITADY